jgi:hypothetical protein
VFDPTQHYSEFGDYEPWNYGHTRPALSFGVDVPIGRGRVAVVPTLRVHYISRSTENEQIGVGSWAVRPGIGVSIRF